MVEKRPYPEDGSLQNGNKRTKSTNASPASATNGSAPVNADFSKKLAEAKARAAALASKFKKPQGNGSDPPSGASGPAPSAPDSIRAKVEAMRAKVAASKAGTAPPQRAPPPPSTLPFPPPLLEMDEGLSRARGGLGIGLHPALMADAGSDSRSKGKNSIAPKFATTMANRRTESPVYKEGKGKKRLDISPGVEDSKDNPYFDPNIGSGQPMGRARISRHLIFNQKGKYIAQAQNLRTQEKMEQIKRKIAEDARKRALDENTEKGFIVPPPPEVEWWDDGLLAEKDYNALSDPSKVKIDTDDSIITIYIQHPVLIQPPQEKLLIPVKPMFLTKTEIKKVRRQRRLVENKEKQAKIRLGLEPPPPPKVKRGNMMRVLGEQAIADPTAVEALVERQIRERQEAHEQANEERKLTKEQRHEKLASQQRADASKGIYMCVFKVDSLAYGKHRYQVDINAKQHALTGCTILNPLFSLIVVEGGEHAIKQYKKLMLQRIKWNENAMPSSVKEGNQEAEVTWLQSVDEKGQLKDLSFNKCQLIFEGAEKQRAFKRWGSRVCETEGEAKEILTRAKMDSFWALAKSLT
ncbi:PRP3-domain-containing protein [Lepidopterella palustris CBS 459.81]|uniref:PRP3-domain-containing protein n=1 Tax=Lepidopterella palustris CBS 459.81 TaxID=1314670 RepID=A0A8E2DZX0_9PEZI|nr:PRP3-domain-containing protein [Lepidopterella palustris CBS 459.81]